MNDAIEAWRQYICRACGLIYDEELGDPDSGLAPGTRFKDIPEDWECPICGVTKADFEPYSRPEPAEPAPSAAPATRSEPGVVIVGAGLAGWSVALALRSLDGELPVTIVTGCNGDVYNKPELSIALARGQSPEALRRETGGDMAARLGVRLLSDSFAVGLAPNQQRLRTTRGTVAYSHLVLASGARPTLPASLPADLCWRINDLAAWSGLYRALGDEPKDVAIVGAGMIGCELAEDFARAGHRVTLLHMEERPLANLLPPPASARLLSGLATLGVTFLGPVEVTAVERFDARSWLATRCGRRIGADVLVAATGLATESRLARSAGLDFRQGILVDGDSLRTSVPNIYALGDCISIDGAPCRFIEPIAKQAQVIAHRILGRPHPGYEHAQPVIRLKTKSTPLVLHGAPHPDGEWRVVQDDPARLVMEQWRSDQLQSRLVA